MLHHQPGGGIWAFIKEVIERLEERKVGLGRLRGALSNGQTRWPSPVYAALSIWARKIHYHRCLADSRFPSIADQWSTAFSQ
jgi:hypothetical protein